jgi:SAM-dependent methyltransferase
MDARRACECKFTRTEPLQSRSDAADRFTISYLRPARSLLRRGTPPMIPTTDLLDLLRSQRSFPDPDFDALFPPPVAALAERHFTPVDVARRAADLLVESSDSHVLDVGSGVGKFCVVGALTTGARFTGVEHRQHFVEHARELARRLGAENAEFFHADATIMDWRAFDGIYLFNPFAENLWTPLDTTVPAEPRLFHQYVQETKERLRATRKGTRVVTFHGFGASMPAGYRLAWREPAGADVLDLWIKEPRVTHSFGAAGHSPLKAA